MPKTCGRSAELRPENPPRDCCCRALVDSRVCASTTFWQRRPRRLQSPPMSSRTHPFANPTLNHPARATAPFLPFDATRLPLGLANEATLANALLVVLRDIQDVLGAAIVRESGDAFASNRPRQICHGPKHVFMDFERMSRSILI